MSRTFLRPDGVYETHVATRVYNGWNALVFENVWPDPNRAYCHECGRCRSQAVNNVCPCGRDYAHGVRGQISVEWIRRSK